MMDDASIVTLYWQRSEAALQHTADKYGRYCHAIALGILDSQPDAEECVNDTWLRAWHSMPPKRPEFLGGFLGRITRNLSLDRLRRRRAARRSGEAVLALEELSDCLPARETAESEFDRRELARALERFLGGLNERQRRLFLLRYWYLRPVKEAAAELGMRENAASAALFRLRRALRTFLEQEGVAI